MKRITMSHLLQRVTSNIKALKVIAKEHRIYQLLMTDPDHLIKKIFEKFPTAAELITFIESQLAQGFIAEDHFFELMANPKYERDLKKFKDRINAVYSKIINIYVDSLIYSSKEAIKGINIAELCAPKTSRTLADRFYIYSRNLTDFIMKIILGFDSLEKYKSRDTSISDDDRVIRRCLRMQLWIEIARQLLEKRDEMSALIVIQALEDPAITRLKKTKKGLSLAAITLLENIVQVKERLLQSDVGAKYYLDAITKTPFIPAVYYMLRPIIQVQQNEAEVIATSSIWAKIMEYKILNDLALLLLKEQHDVFATVIPAWEYVIAKVNSIDNFYILLGFQDRAIINQLNPEIAYEISILMEPPKPITESDTASKEQQAALPSKPKAFPSSELLAYVPRENEVSSLPLGIYDFKTWLKRNYVNKFDEFNNQLQALNQLNIELSKSDKEYSLSELDRYFAIDEFKIASICINWNAINVLYRFGQKMGFDRLNLDQKAIEVALKKLKDYERSLILCRKLYFEIHQRNLFRDEDTLEYFSFKADITDIHTACEERIKIISDYIKDGSPHQLKENKIILIQLQQMLAKYKQLLDQAKLRKDFIGQKTINTLTVQLEEIQRRANSIKKFFGEKEFAYLAGDITLKDIINNLIKRYENLQNSFNNSPNKFENPKKYCSELNAILKQLQEMSRELPLFLENHYYHGRESYHEKLMQLNIQINTFINQCESVIKDIKSTLQTKKSKAQKLIDNSRIDERINIIKQKQPSESHQQTEVIRTRLENTKQLFITKKCNVPAQFKIGKFTQGPDNFFNAVAHTLNALYNSNQFNEKLLRLFCHEFYLRNKDLMLNWQGLINSQPTEESDPYYKIKYTQNEMSFLFNRTALGGSYLQEGRALCCMLELKAICIIQLKYKERNNALTARYFLIDQNNIMQTKKLDYDYCFTNNIPILILDQTNTYIPLQPLSPNLTPAPIPSISVPKHTLPIVSVFFSNPDEAARKKEYNKNDEKQKSDNQFSFNPAEKYQRKKLHKEEYAIEQLKGRIPPNWKVYDAISAGDCFFDSFAQGLNYLTVTNSHNVKTLRLLCSEVAQKCEAIEQKNKQLAQNNQPLEKNPYDWLKEAIMGDEKSLANYQNYLARIAFTWDEMEENHQQGLLLGEATWGRAEIEGRILCQHFGVQLHINGVLDEPQGGVRVAETFINESGEEPRPQLPIEEYNNPKLIHMVNYHLHFVPLLPEQPIPSQQLDQSAQELIPPKLRP